MKASIFSEEIIETDRTDPRVFVDSTVQRDLRTGRAKDIGGTFRPEGLGILTGSRRPDGTIHLVDGQTRWAAAETAQYLGPIRIQVYTGLSHEQEASLFLVRNNMAKPTSLDRFRVRCVDQDPVARAIMAALAKYGWTLGKTNTDNKFIAVAAAESIWRLDPEKGPRAFLETLNVIQVAWSNNKGSARGVVVEGLGRFLYHYGDLVDLASLADRLSTFPGGANGLYGQALAFGARIEKARAVGLTILEAYNFNRKTRKLPPYEN